MVSAIAVLAASVGLLAYSGAPRVRADVPSPSVAQALLRTVSTPHGIYRVYDTRKLKRMPGVVAVPQANGNKAKSVALSGTSQRIHPDAVGVVQAQAQITSLYSSGQYLCTYLAGVAQIAPSGLVEEDGNLDANGYTVAYTNSFDVGYYTADESECVYAGSGSFWFAEVQGDGTWVGIGSASTVAEAFWTGP